MKFVKLLSFDFLTSSCLNSAAVSGSSSYLYIYQHYINNFMFYNYELQFISYFVDYITMMINLKLTFLIVIA